MNGIFDKRKEIVQLVLIFTIVTFSIIYFFYSLNFDRTRDIWLLIGVLGILLIILSELKGVGVFIGIVLLGTLVAREEFILETSALLRGEQLSELRSSRMVIDEAKAISQISESDIKQRITSEKIDLNNLSPEELIQKVENVRNTLTIERAVVTLTDESKSWIRAIAESGGLSSSSKKFKQLNALNDHTGYKYLNFLQAFDFVEWFINENADNDFYILNDRGIQLAKGLGIQVKDQKPPEGYY